MRVQGLWILLMGLFLLSIGCSSEGGTSTNVSGQGCDHFGEVSCGFTPDGRQSVLKCGTTRFWEVQEVCGVECYVYNSQPLCKDDSGDTTVPKDLVSDQVEDLKVDDALDTLNDNANDLEINDVATPDEVEPDLEPLDIQPDFDRPTILSTSPADGEMAVSTDFQVRITFSEPIYAVTVAEQTVKIFDGKYQPIPITFEFEDELNTILVITPQTNIFDVSPYHVELGTMIRDLAGNDLGTPYRFTFYTGYNGNISAYQQLAARFAPNINAETEALAPQLDLFTRFDFDGNWDPTDNVSNIQSGVNKVEPYAYFSVIESKSHYFIFYVFFFPFRHAEIDDHAFGNDVSGAMVVVRKSDEAPVAIETYFKVTENDERSISFVADNNGFIPGGQTWLTNKFDGQYPASALFPNDRYEAYLSARNHESCLWLDEGNSLYEGCALHSTDKINMTKIGFTYQNGTVTPIAKAGGSFPTNKDNVAYGLLPVLEHFWPHRTDVGESEVFASSYEYTPFENIVYKNRPELVNDVGARFHDPLGNDNARPPWAWRYYPQNGTNFYELPRGVFFLDPALHFRLRHDEPNTWSGSDWSVEYCFNPYFSIDFRGIWPECSSVQ